jgi:hypothetical protein
MMLFVPVVPVHTRVFTFLQDYSRAASSPVVRCSDHAVLCYIPTEVPNAALLPSPPLPQRVRLPPPSRAPRYAPDGVSSYLYCITAWYVAVEACCMFHMPVSAAAVSLLYPGQPVFHSAVFTYLHPL